MRFSGFVNFLLLACFTLPAVASGWTDAEIMAMPPYCEAKLKHVPGKYEYWARQLGPDFLHTHHYCYGLGYISRYYHARSRQQKQFNLNNAIGTLNYMESHASPSYSLMPDVYLNRGLVYSLMGNYSKAILDVKKALELNPKLVKAYALAADTYIKLNQKNEALAVVTDGLRHVPDSSVLQRLYKERGGKLPYPEPLARAAETPLAPAEEGREGETAEGAKPQDAIQAAPPGPAPEAAGSEGVRAEDQAPAAPQIGSPTNPWCRFCPDPAK
jgi:tetratricopeptide (TPR) repeat protein